MVIATLNLAQGVIVADIAPAEVTGNSGDQTISGRRLHQHVLDRDLGQRRPNAGQDLLAFVRLPCGGDVLQVVVELRFTPAEFVHEDLYTPDEKAGIPEVLTGLDVFFRQVILWFLDKLLDPEHRPVADRAATTDVAVSRLRPSWR